MTKISVLMSVYNRPELLDKTIKSVFSQSYKNFEFIIVDDGSKKDVKDKLKTYKKQYKRIKLITNKKNLGLTKSLNKGLKATKGEYIARIDNGDVCKKDRLKVQKDFLDKNKDCALVGCNINLINLIGKKIGKITYPNTNKKIKKGIIRTNLFAHSTLMFKKGYYYNENFYYSQDYELILRIGSKQEIANIPKILVDYLYDSNGITASATTRKKQDKFALKAKWLGLTKYDYSKKNTIDLCISFIEFLIPFWIKLFILNLKKGNEGLRIKGKEIQIF